MWETLWKRHSLALVVRGRSMYSSQAQSLLKGVIAHGLERTFALTFDENISAHGKPCSSCCVYRVGYVSRAHRSCRIIPFFRRARYPALQPRACSFVEFPHAYKKCFSDCEVGGDCSDQASSLARYCARHSALASLESFMGSALVRSVVKGPQKPTGKPVNALVFFIHASQSSQFGIPYYTIFLPAARFIR